MKVRVGLLIDPLSPTVVVDERGVLHAVPARDQFGKGHRVTRDTVCGRRPRCELLAIPASADGETTTHAMLMPWPPPARGHGDRCPDCMADAEVFGGRRDRPAPNWRRIGADGIEIQRLPARSEPV